jgi:hypothetical protein
MTTESFSSQNNRSYTDDDIKTLSSLEHIRARPGMYIGRLGNGDHQDDGIYILLKEVIDNSIDEFTSGFGRRKSKFPSPKKAWSMSGTTTAGASPGLRHRLRVEDQHRRKILL